MKEPFGLDWPQKAVFATRSLAESFVLFLRAKDRRHDASLSTTHVGDTYPVTFYATDREVRRLFAEFGQPPLNLGSDGSLMRADTCANCHTAESALMVKVGAESLPMCCACAGLFDTTPTMAEPTDDELQEGIELAMAECREALRAFLTEDESAAAKQPSEPTRCGIAYRAFGSSDPWQDMGTTFDDEDHAREAIAELISTFTQRDEDLREYRMFPVRPTWTAGQAVLVSNPTMPQPRHGRVVRCEEDSRRCLVEFADDSREWVGWYRMSVVRSADTSADHGSKGGAVSSPTTPYEPVHLRPYEVPRHYFGETWEGWYPVASVTRDSGILDRSNFRVIERRLSELPAVEVDEEGTPGVTVTRCSHFLCGWVDTLYVHGSAEEALRLADEFAGRLERYPVLCEDDWSDLESEEATKVWESFSLRDRVDACVRFDVSIFAARRAEVPEDPCGTLVSYLAE